MNFLMQPKKYRNPQWDEGTQAIFDKTIAFFEERGKKRVLDGYIRKEWDQEFVDFIGRERIFAKLLTPSQYGDGDPDCRWDTARNCEYSELLSFYSHGQWYCFQVTILGLGPIWMSKNEKAKQRAAKLLREGAIFAFGLSEKQHGADIYSIETSLTPRGNKSWVANGEKYYIGNGNKAQMVSTFGKVRDGTDDFCFFVANFQHKAYELKKNCVSHQEYVANFALRDYPVDVDDLLMRGNEAWNAALNTVNIGKFNIGPSSIGTAEHCFYEAITHASNRVLYGKRVTDMPHARKNFMDAWLRLVAMKLYQRRASDYFRVANENDRRYLLYNPTSKMKVTLQGEEVINLLWEVIAAKGFEKDTYFHMGAWDIRGPSKLEGTVHVNVQLIRKFMKNYFFNPEQYAPVEPGFIRRDDAFVFNQGPAKGLGTIRFHDYRPIFEVYAGLANVAAFNKQTATLRRLLEEFGPDKQQDADPSFALPLGEMFSIVVYAQLILEQAQIDGWESAIVDQVFDFMVRDFARFALQIYEVPSTKAEQSSLCSQIMLVRPVPDAAAYDKVWREYVAVLDGEYAMNE